MKTGIKIGATAIALALTGAASVYFPIAYRTHQETSKLTAQVVNLTRDPASAQLRSVRLYHAKFKDGQHWAMLCGEINAKSGFGAYAGFSPFIATSDPKALLDWDGEPVAILVADESSSKEQLKEFAAAQGLHCNDFDQTRL